MRTESHLHKIRVVQVGGGTTTYGVTIPATFKSWVNLYVSIKESGGALILESGAKPVPFTNKELKQFTDVVDKIKL